MVVGGGADAPWGGTGLRGLVPWRAGVGSGGCDGPERGNGTAWTEEGAWDVADRDQVNPSRRRGLYSRAEGWVVCTFLCGRGMGSDVCFGKLALLLWGGWMGVGTQGG